MTSRSASTAASRSGSAQCIVGLGGSGGTSTGTTVAGTRWLALGSRYSAGAPQPVVTSGVPVTAIGPGGGAALEEHLWLAATLFGSVPPLRIGEAARRHGRLVLAVADHARLQTTLGQLAFLPRSFSAERMVALHGGAPSGAGLWWTRARHAARGLGRRAGGGSPTRR